MTRTTFSQLDVYERHAPRPALIEPVSTYFAEGVTQALSLSKNMRVDMWAPAVASFTNEVGQTAPVAASTVGAGGVTINVAGSGTVGGSGFASTATDTTFTATHNSGLITYYGEDASPVAGVPNVNNPPSLARARWLAAIGTTQTSSPPTTINFENQTTGATSLSINVANYYSTQTGTGINTDVNSGTIMSVTGATVANGASNGRFSTSSLNTNGKYLACTAGVDVVFTFNYGVSAFSFYATDVSDVEGAMTVYMLPDDGGAEESVVVKSTAGANGNLLFFGFTTTAKRYTRVRVACATPTDIFGLDDVTTACGMMVLDPNPMKAFGVTLLNYLNTAGTTYTATVVTTQDTYNFTLPLTVTNGKAFWGFKCNGGHKIVSVTFTSSNVADPLTFDDAFIGFPYYS